MKHIWLVTALAIGCSSKQTIPACTRDTDDLHEWLTALVAGGSSPLLPHAHLATLDEGPGRIEPAPVLEVGERDVTYQGAVVATRPLAYRDPGVRDALAGGPPATDLLLVIDAGVAWRDVVAVAAAAHDAGRSHVTFVFAAGKPGAASPPPPSEIDGLLADPKHPASRNVPRVVFENCPVDDLFAQLENAGGRERDQLVVDGFPKAIAACSCKVEMASVRRLLWAWYRRDEAPAVVGVPVVLASTDATRITAKPGATWADAAREVRAAAKTGRPIVLD